MASLPQTAPNWLLDHGPKQLELLFRAIIYHPSTPVLIADDEGNSRDASAGAGKLLGFPRQKIIGRKIDEFAPPSLRPEISQLWRAFLEEGDKEGTLPLLDSDGSIREVEFTAKRNVLPVRHVIALREKAAPSAAPGAVHIPLWVQDYALYLLNTQGCVAAWYAGAERIYGYAASEAIGEELSFLYSSDDALEVKLQEELRRAESEGHAGSEGWQTRKGGACFW